MRTLYRVGNCLSGIRTLQPDFRVKTLSLCFPWTRLQVNPAKRNSFSIAHARQEDSRTSNLLDLPSPIPVTAEDSTVSQPLTENPTREDLEEQDWDDFPVPRLPRSVQAIYLKPLKRTAKYGLPACDLQLRSYSVRNLEFFADFALRAAYYLHLPAAGPVPLPRITERWTVPRANFIFKKSQENFQRITLRRLIQIQDGNPETVEIWLAFLRKHAYYGVGMKANVWGYEKLGVGKTMDVSLENLKQVLEPKWAQFGRRTNLETFSKVSEMINGERFQTPIVQ